MGAFGFLYFAMLNTMVPGWIFLAIVLSFIPHDTMYGPQAAMIAECFIPRLRYSGSSLGFHLASVIAGGPAPLIATALLASTGSGYSVAIYVLMCSIVSVSATALLAGLHEPRHLAGARLRRAARRGDERSAGSGPRRLKRECIKRWVESLGRGLSASLIDPLDLLEPLDMYQGTTPSRAPALTALQVYLDPDRKYRRSDG